MRISVIKSVEQPSGEVTDSEVCTFNEQIPMYDTRQAPYMYTLPASRLASCPILLNGKNTIVSIPVFAMVARADKMGSLPTSDVKVFGTAPWVSGGDVLEMDIAFSATRDLDVWNLITASTPQFKETSGTKETLTIYADMNELQ